MTENEWKRITSHDDEYELCWGKDLELAYIPKSLQEQIERTARLEAAKKVFLYIENNLWNNESAKRGIYATAREWEEFKELIEEHF